MRYTGMVIRPPSEASSYILQVTYGCSHNKCAFCGTYLDKPFSVRPEGEVYEDIDAAARLIPETRRVFLADGDAMVLSTRRLIRILEALRGAFPLLERVGIYANARDILRKPLEDLTTLKKHGLGIAYIGLESGSDEVLERVHKGADADEMVEAVQRLKRADIAASVIAILGLAGPGGSAEHAAATARVVRRLDPDYFALLTLMLVPGTPLYQEWQDGTFELMDPYAMLAELRAVIAGLQGLAHCIFRTNHASNYLPIGGTLSRDRDRLLLTIDSALKSGEKVLRPESWRRL
jgi:radical SAM superfamily enzyme YgiQ (UPF0313 family)